MDSFPPLPRGLGDYVAGKLYGRLTAYRAKRADVQLHREGHYVWMALEKSRTAGGINHSQQHLRLLELARLVDRYQPASVLELGGGTTTAVFAHKIAPMEDGTPAVTSLEETEHWQATARDIVAPADRGRVDFVLRPRVLETSGTQKVARYDYSYDQDYDLVYVDGPSNHDPENRSPGVRLPLVDALCLIRANHPPRVIVVDSKRHSVRFFREQGIERRYRMILKSAFLPPRQALFTGYRHHTVFERK